MRIFYCMFKTLALTALTVLLVGNCSAPETEKVSPEPAGKSEGSWKVLGPGGGGAQFLSTVNPADPDNVFVRCDMTGAYVTLDGGKSWRMFNLRTVVQDFEFDPNQPNTVYAANSGLYRSEDRGSHWRLIYPDPAGIAAERMIGDHADHRFELADGTVNPRIEKVRVDPANSDHIYIGQPAPYVYSAAAPPRREGESVVVMLSTDRGQSWQELVRAKGQDVLAIFPGSWEGKPDEVTVITDRSAVRVSKKSGEVTELPLPVERIMAAGGGGSTYYVLAPMQSSKGRVSGGVYRSTDRGKSWKQVNTGLLEDWQDSGELPGFRAFVVCEGDSRVAYLSCSDYMVKVNGEKERQFGIFKTEDSGETWRWVYRANNDKVLGDNHKAGWMAVNYGPEWGEYPLSLGVSPTDADICYANDFGCTYRTLDGGATWEQVYTKSLPDGSWTSRGLDVTTCYGVHFDPFDPQHIFISYTDIGAFHSFNSGRSWLHAIQGAPRAWRNTCYWMVFDPEVKGRAWSVWGSGHDLPRPKMFRSGNFHRYVGGAAVSDDGCRTWSQSNAGMPPNTVSTHIVLDPRSPKENRTLYVCGFGKGVFKSTDSGASWVNSSNGVGPNMNAWRITMLPDGTMYLLVARGLENRQTVDGALYRSDNSAGTWQNLPLPEGVNAPNDLVYDPTNPQRMYLSCWPQTKGGREHAGGLLRTDDSGQSWERVFEEQAHVYAAAVDPDNPSTVFINTFNSAAFRSDDSGDTWKRLEGYNFKWGHRPVIDPHNPGMLYLTTFGGSVFYGPATGIPEAFEDIVDPAFTMWYGKY